MKYIVRGKATCEFETVLQANSIETAKEKAADWLEGCLGHVPHNITIESVTEAATDAAKEEARSK